MYYDVNTDLVKYLYQYMNEEKAYGKKVSEGVHRTNDQIDVFYNSDSQGGFEQVGSTKGAKHLLPFRENWSGGNTVSSDRGTISGGNS
ncbi:MAG: hypothetical protein F6K08_32570 [Okeania sp. SIO1H6]|nr:hypothetical protein [Okeania sp. SIO1H6]